MGLLFYTLFIIGVWIPSFVVVGSLASRIHSSPFWMLAAAVFLTLLLPFLIAAWLRGVRRKPGLPKTQIRPRRRSLLGLINTALLLAAVLAIPQTTKNTLHAFGSWPAELLLSDTQGKTRTVRISRKVARWLSSTLPGTEPLLAPESTPERNTAVSPQDGGSRDSAPGTEGLADLRASPNVGRDSGEDAGNAQELTLAFERRGNAIVVPVRLTNGDDSVDVKMIFDTGATLTTIDSPTLEKLGLAQDHRNPTISVHTANGTVQRQIMTLDKIAIESAAVPGGLTVSLCEPCARGDVVGLLGLNYSRHFQVILDTDAGKLRLKRKRPSPGHLADIRPFVSFKEINGIRRGKSLEVSLTLHNDSDRAIEEAVVAVVWEKKRYYQNTGFVSPQGKKDVSLKAKLDSSRKGSAFQVELHQARW